LSLLILCKKEDERLHLVKNCKEHGIFENLHIYDHPVVYKEMRRIFGYSGGDGSKGCQPAGEKTYPRDLILYVTERCNLACAICYQRANEKGLSIADDPSIETILDRIKDFKGEFILLSGGEPTLRDDIFEIIRRIKGMGFRVGMFTNGIKLKDREYVRKMNEAGVVLVILQFDSMHEDHLHMMRGKELLDVKMLAVANMRAEGVWTYMFGAVAQELNLKSVGALIDYAVENIDVVKIINFNPIWLLGRNSIGMSRVSNSKILEVIEEQTGINLEDMLVGTEAAYYVFEVYRKMFNDHWTRQPACALRTYLYKFGDKDTLPLNRIFDLPGLTQHLIKMSENVPNKKSKFRRVLWLATHLPYGFAIKQFIQKPHFRRMVGSIMWNGTKSLIKYRSISRMFKSIQLLSVMVGIFHSKHNIDLDVVSLCTLHSDFVDGKNRASACIKQIFQDEKRTSILTAKRESVTAKKVSVA